MADFIIRRYIPGDEYKIIQMFNEVFYQNRELSYWYWKYRDNPYGTYIISVAVTGDGILAAHYAGYPVRLYCCLSMSSTPSEFTTYHLGDKMTRRQFRSVGYGKSALLKRTFMHFQATYARDIPFGYGFGTHHSLKFGLLFLNYVDIEPVPYRRLTFDRVKGKIDNRLRNIISSIHIEEISDVDDTWSDFFYHVAPSYQYLVKRDAAYMRWRYLQRPDRRYLVLSLRKRAKLIGWSVFYRESSKLIWVDALFDPKNREFVQSILIYLCRHPIAEGVDFIECWFPQRPSWWDTVLHHLGFIMEKEPNNLHFTGPMFNDHNAPEMLRKYFYYTMGESDLF